MLYFIATPIGNLSDITLRALAVLRSCDYILCEDTRHSRKLLSHYSIDKPLKSYHKFNELERIDLLIEDLHKGLHIGLICDAGTPSISDPGFLLAERCRKEGLPLLTLPGPCALIAALSLSGLCPQKFQFVGFLPKKPSSLKETLTEMLAFFGTSICYETPHRILDTLKTVAALDPQRKLVIARELTKLHEEQLAGTAEELLSHFQKTPPKGEMVLLMEGAPTQETRSLLLCKQQVTELCDKFEISQTLAIKLVAHLHQIPKKALYNLLHDLS